MTDFSLAHLFAAACFFLYGLHLAEDGLRLAAGDRLRMQLGRLTRHRLVAFGFGALMTLVLQSSTATTTMLVGLASIGYLSTREAMAVVLGADVGTAVLVLLLASFVRVDTSVWALWFLVAGFAASYLLRNRRAGWYANAFLGVGFVFFGLSLFVAAGVPLRDNDLFRRVVSAVAEHTGVAVVFGALCAGFIQSSAAVLGVLLSFCAAGLMTGTEAVPFVLGANLGSVVGPLIAGVRAQVAGKRLASFHLLSKMIVLLLLVPFVGPMGSLVREIAVSPSYQVAATHIIFNLIVALLFLPVIPAAVRVIAHLVPQRTKGEGFGPKYLDPSALESPALAFANVFREILRMAEITQEMCAQVLAPFEEQDRASAHRLEEMDDQIDRLDREIKFYLARLARPQLTEEQSRRQLELLILTHDLESVGDVICKEMMELADKRRRKNVSFSSEGWEEIRDFHRRVMENFSLAITSFATGDMELGRKVLRHKKQLAEIEQDLSQRHLLRLHQGMREAFVTSSLHLDILSNLRRINSIVSKMAYPVLDRRAS